MKNRKNELSAASVVLMLLVIFIHVVAECVSSFDRGSIQYAVSVSLHRLSSFAVQGFIFLSGVKLFLSRKDFSLGRFYLGRLRRVVLPYIAAFSLFFVFFIVTKRITPSAGYFFGELFSGGLVGHFYFVAVICQFYLLIPLWRLIVKKASPILALTVSLILMIIFNSSMPEMLRLIFGVEFKYNARIFTTYVFYFIAGAFAGANYDCFTAELSRQRRGIYAVFTVVGIADCVNIWLIGTRRAYPSWAENLHVLYCISAILALMYAASRITSKESRLTSVLTLIERASYNVYLIHPLFIFLTESVLFRCGITSLSARFAAKFAATYVCSIGICLLFESVKKKIRKRDNRSSAAVSEKG